MATNEGFTSLLIQIMNIFTRAYEIAEQILVFMGTPMIETMPEIADILGPEFANWMPLELLVGLGLITALMTAIFKFFFPM